MPVLIPLLPSPEGEALKPTSGRDAGSRRTPYPGGHDRGARHVAYRSISSPAPAAPPPSRARRRQPALGPLLPPFGRLLAPPCGSGCALTFRHTIERHRKTTSKRPILPVCHANHFAPQTGGAI